MIITGRKAVCDHPGHVVAFVGGTECGMDLKCAEKLLEDLTTAVAKAKQTYSNPCEAFFRDWAIICGGDAYYYYGQKVDKGLAHLIFNAGFAEGKESAR